MNTEGTGTAPHQPDALLVETLDRMLANTSTHEAVQAAEANGWAPEIWHAMADMGAPWVGVSDAIGGSGGTIADAAAVLRRVGYHAVPLPIAETGLLGAWLLGSAGIAIPDGPLSVVPGRPDDDLRLDGGNVSGTAHNVPWASRAELIVALLDGRIVALSPSSAVVTVRRNVAGEPREVIAFDAATPVASALAPDGVDAATLRLTGAFARSCLMTGALERVSDLTVGYANERHQFGKPVATFQAVAQHLVKLASETQLVTMALQSAVAAVSRHGFAGARFEVAAFKAVAGEAASLVTTRGHQVHGAIGMTQEYRLHQFSRRLWSWREEYGSTSAWRREVGACVAGLDGDHLWQRITEGSDALVG